MLTKTVVVASALIAVAAPALASTQLERSLSLPKGAYSLSDLAKIKAASESGERTPVRVTGANGQTVFVHVN